MGGEALARSIAGAQRFRGAAIAVLADNLDQVRNPRARAGLFTGWAATRSPALEAVITSTGLRPPPDTAEAALALLHFDGPVPPTTRTGTEATVALLADGSPQLAATAAKALRDVTTETALAAVGRCWIDTREPLLAEIVKTARVVPAHPDEARLLVGLLVDREALRDVSGSALDALLAARNDPDVGDAARDVAARLTHAAAHETLTHRALAGDEDARQLCVQGGYLPPEDHERALFLFLTSQWDRYQELDFDGRLLAAAYAVVPANVQRDIRRRASTAGRTNVLRVVLGGDRRARIGQLTQDEAAFLVEQTAAAGEFEQLWRLVFDLPLPWALPAAARITQAGWTPDRPAERTILTQLSSAHAQGLHEATQQIARRFPVAAERATVAFNGRINALAFTPSAPRMLIGSNQRVVGVWDLQRARLLARYTGFASSVGGIAALDADRYIVGTRTVRPQRPCELTTIDHRRRRTRRVGQHRGSVTGIVACDGYAVSVGRDSCVRTIDRGGTVRQVGRPLPDWPRAVTAMGDDHVVAVHSGLSRVNVATGAMTHAAELFRRMPTAVTVGPGSADVLTGFRNGDISVIRFQGSTYKRHANFEETTAAVTAMASLPKRRLVLTATDQGAVLASLWPNRSRMGELNTRTRVTSLTVSPSEEFLAVGHPDDSASLWDLRVSDVPALLTRPLLETAPSALSMLDAAIEGAPLQGQAKAVVELLRTMLRHRFRHDIEVEELVGIRAGRYDIAID